MESIISEIKKEYPILSKARTFMVQRDFFHAAEAYAELLELMVQKEKEDSIKMAAIYLEYANALILTSDKIVLNPEIENDQQYIEDLEIAWEVLEVAKNVFSTKNMDQELFQTRILLSEIAQDTNNYAMAKEDLLEAYSIIEKNPEEQRKCADILLRVSALEKMLGNPKESMSRLSLAVDTLKKLSRTEEVEELMQECNQKIEEINNPEKYKVDFKKFSSIINKSELIKKIQIKKDPKDSTINLDKKQAPGSNESQSCNP